MDDGVIVYSNPRFEQMFGYEKGEMLGKHVSILNAPTDKSAENTFNKIMDDLAKNGFWNGEVKNIRKDGTPFWSYARVIAFDHSQFGKVLVDVHEDITERRKAEEKIRMSLKEKETLLHEIHHRVRNNLQAIIAMVRMRARLTHDAETLQFLNDLENQAYAMALVYEQLHQSENLALVGMAQYLLKLTTNVMVTYGRPDSIQFHLDAPLAMDMEHATPCGLIVNELFSNILKHAFPPSFRGKPTVSIILKQDDKVYQLTVSDNGVGISPGYDWHKSQSMGLHLVNLWATHQLGGTLAVSGKSGTTFTITFNLKD
jgi:hypothetical protein